MINPFAPRREVASDHQINHLWLSRRELTSRSIIERSVFSASDKPRRKMLKPLTTLFVAESAPVGGTFF
jgi:hypothetical protein